MLPATSSSSEIPLSEIQGDRDWTDDFVFVRIGSSIPLSSSSFSFDLQSPPSQPLSISNRHGLLFISHPQQGFLVVKTNDVIAASKEIKEDNSKELSVEDVCVMDVKIGSVETLAVSDDEDESLLAAAVGNEIFFYKVASFLNKMQEPVFLCSLSNSVTVKDFKWQKKMTDTSFVVLSTHGSLYHSTSEAKLNKIMDGVDAVDWSREGDYIAVARKHSISILSSVFKEIVNMPLIFESWQTLTDSGGTIIVDAIKWLLDDSIILGCHQVDEDGAEEGYLIQVIKSQKRKISEISCNPTVYSFSDLFDGVWDILPSGSGPYLLANYLDHWGAVLLSNKKAIDQHISLLKWSSMDDNKKVVALELSSDKYTPKIEVPVNGDDNLVFGFCIGTVSPYEKINIKIDENVHELSPPYALFYLTSEGKLILFHAARISEPTDLHQTLPHLDDSDVVGRRCNTNFLNESIAEPVLNGIQIPTSKDLPKRINEESPNFQKGTFELPGNTLSPHKQQVGTFIGQTEKFSNLFSDTVNSGDVEATTFSEKSSHTNKENLGNSLSMTRDANGGHTLQGSVAAEHEDSLRRKSDMSTAQSLLEHIRASKSKDDSKQFYNVKDMTEELDILLSYIEKEGGFKDACTSYWDNSVRALEDDLWHLSERSRNCQKSMEEQLMDIQQLQNKMLQVSARKIYMEGIVELASNKTYWDIWNRQKLDSELEVKQQNILNANQNLIREIIELERHFNNLEINKFGDIGISISDHAAFRRSQVSLRQKPLLQSLYNTVDSHLSAAELLSELLSGQMSNLNINSCSVEKKSITQEFLESNGLSQEHNSFQSPPFCRSVSLLPSSIRRIPLSTTNSLKGYHQRSLLYLINASEPETAWRRRVSLDSNWTTFKPPKTKVKREAPDKFSSVDKDVPFRKAKESFDAKKKDFETHQKRVQDNHSKQQLEVGSNVIPMWTNDTSGSPPIESNSNQVVGIQRTFMSPSASLSACPIPLSSSSSSSSLSSTSTLPLSTSSSSSLFPSSSSFGRPLFSAFTSSSTAPVSTIMTKRSCSAVSADKPSSDSKPASPKSVTAEKVETSLPNSSSSFLSTNNTNTSSSVSQPQPAASSSITMPSSTEDKSKPSDANLSDQEEGGMEEEAPDTTGGFNLVFLSGMELGSTMPSTPPKQNSSGGSFLTASSNNQSSMSSPFALQTSPGQGELSCPASFTIPSAQPAQPSSSSSQGVPSGFGQTSKIGVGQQALGSVLGSFGVSRQIGAGIVQNAGSSSTNNVVDSGFAAAGGGFAAAAVKGGGFAAIASGGGGGFGALGSGGGFSGAGSGSGFAGARSGGGFGGAGSNASSGFAFPTVNNAGGGFGAASGFKSDGFGGLGFGNNQGGGGMFPSFGGNNAASGTGKPPASPLFTQMRK